MLVHGFAPAPDLHFGYTVPSIRSSLRRVVRLNYYTVKSYRRSRLCFNQCGLPQRRRLIGR
jgi:hypothetical protein